MKMNNKIILYLIFSLMLIVPMYALPDGLGTEVSPYLVSDCGELQSLNDNTILDSLYYVELDNDIDCSGSTFIPIGTANTSIYTKLNFNGNDYTISNIINTSIVNNYGGVFVRVRDSTIHNLYLDNITFNGNTDYLSSLVGLAYNSTISKVIVTNSKIGIVSNSGSDKNGGFIGSANLVTIEEIALYDVGVYGDTGIGGLFGQTQYVTINNCILDNVTIDGYEGQGTYDYKGYANFYTRYNLDIVNSIFATTYARYNYRPMDVLDYQTRLASVINLSNILSDSNTTSNIETYSNTTENLMKLSTYSDPSWDMDTVWFLNEDENYPCLRWDEKYCIIPPYSLEGVGTEVDPFEIYNCSDFQEIINNNTAYYDVMNDIDFNDCSYDSVDTIFYGSLNGNGYTLNNYIGCGLFDDVRGHLHHLTLNNAYGDCSSVNGAGFIAGVRSGGNMNIEYLNIYNSYMEGNERIALIDGWASSSSIYNYIYNSSFINNTVKSISLSYPQFSLISSNANGMLSGLKSINNTITAPDGTFQGGIYVIQSGSNDNIRNSYSDTKVIMDSMSFYEGYGLGLDDIIDTYYFGSAKNPVIAKNLVDEGSNFYNSDINGIDCQSTTEKGNCSNTDDMQTVYTFIEAGWDFDTVWGLNDYDSYPCLLWEDDCIDYSNYLEIVDLQISNESNFINTDKIYYDLYDPVYYALNFTDGIDPILNGSCWFTFYNPVEIDTATETDFTLCNNCDYNNYDYDFTLSNLIYIDTDYIELNACHNLATNNDIDISYTCGVNTYYETLSASQIPSCSEDEIINQIEISECISYSNVNIEIDNIALNEVQGHNINSLRILREVLNRTVNTSNAVVYDESLEMYVLNHEHYYNTMGGKLVEGGCSTQEAEQTIIIENLIPVINLDTLYNDCDSITEPGDIQYCNNDWVFVTPIEDDNLETVFYNISCDSGEYTDTLTYSEWLEDGLVLDGDNFKDFANENVCSFYMLVTDSYNQTDSINSTFTVIDDISPVCIGVDDENIGIIGSVALNITCEDERLDTFFISCYNPYNSEILLEHNESNINNESYKYQDFVFVYDMVVCSIIATDEGNGSIQYAKILRYDSTFSESGVSAITTQNYNSSLQAGVCPNNDGALAMLGFVLIIAGFLFVLALVWSSRVLGFVSALFIFVFAWNVGACSSIFGILVTGLGIIVIAMSVFGIETKEKGFY
ncbi:MAG: hypothetical protein ACTSR1_00570 [Candidatus Heimdallarchaeota archaeon]